MFGLECVSFGIAKKHTTCGPCFRLLLKLEKHISAGFIVLEKMNVVDDKDQWFLAIWRTAQGDFLKFIHGYKRTHQLNKNTQESQC